MFMAAWVIAIVLVCIFGAFATAKSNVPQAHMGWSAAIAVNGVLAAVLWAIVARFSKHVLFDSMLWDVLQTIVFTVVLALLGAGKGFNTQQWVGVGVVVAGFVLIKVKL